MVLRFKRPPSIFIEQTQEVWFSRPQRKSHCSMVNWSDPNLLFQTSAQLGAGVRQGDSGLPELWHNTALILGAGNKD